MKYILLLIIMISFTLSNDSNNTSKIYTSYGNVEYKVVCIDGYNY